MHAFYQAVGEDTFNPIAGRRVTVNAQMAAAEISYDKDWIRYRISTFYTSGDANPRDSRARGFDAIVDLPNFAGGLFSFWNREGVSTARLWNSPHHAGQPDSFSAGEQRRGPGQFRKSGNFSREPPVRTLKLRQNCGASPISTFSDSNAPSRWNFCFFNRRSITPSVKTWVWASGVPPAANRKYHSHRRSIRPPAGPGFQRHLHQPNAFLAFRLREVYFLKCIDYEQRTPIRVVFSANPQRSLRLWVISFPCTLCELQGSRGGHSRISYIPRPVTGTSGSQIIRLHLLPHFPRRTHDASHENRPSRLHGLSWWQFGRFGWIRECIEFSRIQFRKRKSTRAAARLFVQESFGSSRTHLYEVAQRISRIH